MNIYASNTRDITKGVYECFQYLNPLDRVGLAVVHPFIYKQGFFVLVVVIQ